MKNCKNFVFGISLLVLVNINIASAQNVAAQRRNVPERIVPELVVEMYKAQYPNVLLQGYYATHLVYWQNDYSSDWYNGWYNQRTVVVYTYEQPNYYEIEFINGPGELSRAIYNKYGYWYETRSKIPALTSGIHEALKSSKYAGWKISPMKEKIESPMWPVAIYRFHVSKGLKSTIVRMDVDGNVIQAKVLNE